MGAVKKRSGQVGQTTIAVLRRCLVDVVKQAREVMKGSDYLDDECDLALACEIAEGVLVVTDPDEALDAIIDIYRARLVKAEGRAYALSSAVKEYKREAERWRAFAKPCANKPAQRDVYLASALRDAGLIDG